MRAGNFSCSLLYPTSTTGTGTRDAPSVSQRNNRRTPLQGQADQNKQFFIMLTNSVCKHNKNRPRLSCFPHSASTDYDTSVCHTVISKDSIYASWPANTFQSRYHVTISPDSISEQNNDWNLKKDKYHDHNEHRKTLKTKINSLIFH